MIYRSGYRSGMVCSRFLGDIARQAGANEYAPAPEWLTSQDRPPAAQPTASPAVVGDTPPRLVTALNQTAVPDYLTSALYTSFKQKKGSELDFASPGAFEISYLISHVYDRLKQPFVDASGQSAAGSPWSVAGAVDADEHWARRVAEMMSLSPYTLPSTAYSSFIGPKFGDGHVLYKLQDESDPAHPLVYECQQSVSAAAITRGFGVPVKKPDNSGATPSLVGEKLFGAGPSAASVKALKLRPLPSPPDPNDPYADPEPATAETLGLAKWGDRSVSSTALAQLPAIFQPGSSFAFNNSFGNSQNASDHPHTAFAMRVARGDDGKLKYIQYFDVGGMNVPEPDGKAIANTACYEYPWASSGQAGAQGAFCGYSALGPTPSALQFGIAQLAKSRPLGLARLVIARRKRASDGKAIDLVNDDPKDWLLYASPLVRMYENDADRNYSITRYLWSLRGLPGAEHVSALWLISVPRAELAEAMIVGVKTQGVRQPPSRSTTLTQLVADVVARQVDGLKTLSVDKALPAQRIVLGVIDLRARADGKVEISDVCKSTADSSGTSFRFVARDNAVAQMPGSFALKTLPWGKATTQVAGLDVATLADVPAYFKDPV